MIDGEKPSVEKESTMDMPLPNAAILDRKMRIVELLQKDGIDIARRTVAKYRGQLGIGSSAERRRRKALEIAK